VNFPRLDVVGYAGENSEMSLNASPSLVSISMEMSLPGGGNISTAGQVDPSHFHGTRTFITFFTTASFWSLSYARQIHITLKIILILSFLHHLYLPSSLFSWNFTTDILYTFPLLMHDERHFFKLKKATDVVGIFDWVQDIKCGLFCTDLKDILGMYGGGVF
jgi:hypothetical protein